MKILPQILNGQSSKLNLLRPYQLTKYSNNPIKYIFTTDNGIKYIVTFLLFQHISSCKKTIEFSFFPETNTNYKYHDDRISSTIIYIIDNFFIHNPDYILLFLCLDENKRSAKGRMSLFEKWFEKVDLGYTFNIIDAGDTKWGLISNTNNSYIKIVMEEIIKYFSDNE